ncbi:MAG TPA: hypothetical protein VK818_12395 [Methylomirabilota bacterium]|nr:hypothetical protein [Methylomirabilota bacterium]
MADEKLRKHFGDYLGMAEVAILPILAVLISLTALATIARSSRLLWDTWHQWMAVRDTEMVLLVLDQLLVVLMLVEILHTVRISIRFAHTGYRTVSSCRTDCFDTTHSGDYLGSRGPDKRG